MHRTYLVFPSKSIQTDGVRAGVMSSFGFGQVGGTALVIHPRYLFGALEPSYYAAYKQRNRLRYLESYKAMSEMMIKNNLVKIKEKPPYPVELEDKILTNSLARVTADAKTGSYTFNAKQPTSATIDSANVKAVTQIMDATPAVSEGQFTGIGVDQGLLFISYDLIFIADHHCRVDLLCSFAQPNLRRSQLHRC